MDKSLNDSNFKVMVFLPLLATIANCGWAYVKLSANDWSVSAEDADFIDNTTKLLSFLLYIFLFTSDLKLLRSKDAYCPAWGWFFIPPVYFYKRQKHNSLGLSFFLDLPTIHIHISANSHVNGCKFYIIRNDKTSLTNENSLRQLKGWNGCQPRRYKKII